MQGCNGVFHGIAHGIAHMLRCSGQRSRETVLLQVGLGVGLGIFIEMPKTELLKHPLAGRFVLRRKTGGLVTLGAATDVDIETYIVRHSGLSPVMPTNVVFANMRGGIAVFLQRFRHGDGFRCHVSGLLGAAEACLLFGDAALAVAIEVTDNVDVVMNPSGILPREHRRPRWSTIGLGVGMREAEPFVRQAFEVGGLIVFALRAHGGLRNADLVPAQIVYHHSNNVWSDRKRVGQGLCGHQTKRQCNKGSVCQFDFHSF